MQIHELNNYKGTLDSSAYLAVDNGSDTGKVSTTELLAEANAAVSQLDTFLNGRIDNIIAGGEAPSASEIVDARYGADGVTYPSLGAAIRDQVADVKSDLDERTIIANNGFPIGFSFNDGALYATYDENPTIGNTDVRMNNLVNSAMVYDRFDDLSRFSNFNGSPVLSSEHFVSSPTSMKCSGTSSQQGQFIISNLEVGTYYIACAVYVPTISAGKAGVSITSDVKTLDSGFTNANTKFKNASVLFPVTTDTAMNITVGTYSSANGTAYIDDLLVVRLEDVFDTIPTYDELYAAYEAWVGNRRSRVRISNESQPTYTHQECVNRFITAMSDKANNIGMTDTNITTPSGADVNNTSTAIDLLKMLTCATSYNDLCRVWNKKNYTIEVKGDNARSITINSTVADAAFEAVYTILGGKTGSWQISSNPTTYMNNLVIVGADSKGRVICGVIMHATTSNARFPAMLELFNIAERKLDNSSYDTSNDSISNAECAIAWELPSFNTAMCEGYEPTILFAQNSSKVYATASTIKTLAMMTALEHGANLDERYTMCADDIVGGSGQLFQTGDIVSVRDLFFSAMLESSNQGAVAIAHYSGKKILIAEA